MTKEELSILINSDLYRYEGQVSPKYKVMQYFRNPGFKYTYILRKCRYYKQRKFYILQYIFFKYLLKKYTIRYGYEIHENVRIGKGFYICHIGGIVINPKSIIGNNVNITKGVTIGQANRGAKMGAPIIGDKVWIGTNASIVGKIRIGDNVLIAANSFVNFDVPSNSIVIGNPAKIYSNEKATESYINNIFN